MRRLKHFGVLWPRMQEDMHICISSCERYEQNLYLPYATLFQVQANPRWGQHIGNYLQHKQFAKTMNKRRRKSIETKVLDFTIIRNKIYKRGILWLCHEKQYLAQAHSSIVGGHFSVAKAILMSRIWWPTLSQDNYAYVQA